MADLLNEVQRLESCAWSITADVPGCVALSMVHNSQSDPLLLDEVYSVAPTISLTGAADQCGDVRTAAKRSALGPPWIAEPLAVNSICQTGTQTLAHSSATGIINSPAVAAVAAYRRQYFGLESSASGSAAAGGTAAQASSTKPAYTLKSRPAGKLEPDYGPQHIPGYLPKAAENLQQLSALPNLPAKSGTGQTLPPARLQPGSCCPPRNAEPLVPMNPNARAIIAERQADRVLDPALLINRLVYDSLEPPITGLDSNGDWPLGTSGTGSGCSSGVSSCRTTGSTRTSNSDSTLRGDSGGPVAAAAAQTPAATAEPCQYAPELSCWYVPQDPDDTTLVFESRFECGNLRRAVQVQPFEYDLVLQPDLNTRGHTQWYFFAVSNTRPRQAYRFNIINLLKEDSLYNMGMLPLMHSEHIMQTKGQGWFRTGSHVYYGPNSIKKGKQTYYTLTFEVEFPFNNDWVHLAHCYPYSYTDLQHQLHVICKEPNLGFVVDRCCLAVSLAGNAVDLLTITAAATEGKPLSQRQGVVLSARVHPGETNASWMMQGVLQQLLGSCADSKQLRENFVFKVVPMLNPDGVIVGNYRCSLAGLDLNRVWQDPDSRVQPVVWAYKGMIKAFIEEREVVMFCDMHGHSRKYGVFIYGCEKKAGKDSTPLSPGWPVPGTVGGLPGIPVKCQPNIFPLMLYLNAPNLFSYKSCNFKVQKSKAGTGRVVGFRELGLVNAFTIEASFCGAAVGQYAKQHFNTGHLEDMGSAVVRTLLDYWAPAETNSALDLAGQLTGAAVSSTSAACPALGLLLDAAVGPEEDDVCTDSDDESSDDDPSPQRALGRGAASVKKLNDSATAEELDVATKLAATISNNVAQLSNRLVAMLSSAWTGDKGVAAGVGKQDTPAFAEEAAAPSAASILLSALQQQQACTTGSSAEARRLPASSVAVTRKGSQNNSRNQSNNNWAGEQKQPAGINSSSPTAVDAASAAQQLLYKLTMGAAGTQKVQCSGAAGVTTAASGHSSSKRLTQASSALAGVTAPEYVCLSANVQPTAVEYNSARRCTGTSFDTAVCSQQQIGLTWEEAALVSMPGFVDLLQQLVDQQAALNAAVVTAPGAAGNAPSRKGGKKKGRRKHLARYGNPEVLRAARARADATLAAALPALGSLDGNVDAAAQVLPVGVGDDGEIDNFNNLSAGHTAGPFSAPASAGSDGSREMPNPVRVITSGRRANTIKQRSSKSSMLDAERYITLLDKQKRHTGGVLASSSIDDPWGGVDDKVSHKTSFSRCGYLSPGVQGTCSSSISQQSPWEGGAATSIPRSGSCQSRQQPIAGCSPFRGPADAATGSLSFGPAGSQGAFPSGSGPGFGRRSKSAQPGLQDAASWQHVESAVQDDALASCSLLWK